MVSLGRQGRWRTCKLIGLQRPDSLDSKINKNLEPPSHECFNVPDRESTTSKKRRGNSLLLASMECIPGVLGLSSGPLPGLPGIHRTRGGKEYRERQTNRESTAKERERETETFRGGP
jgi:hypothetical protein